MEGARRKAGESVGRRENALRAARETTRSEATRRSNRNSCRSEPRRSARLMLTRRAGTTPLNRLG